MEPVSLPVRAVEKIGGSPTTQAAPARDAGTRPRLSFSRYFTKEGVHPYDEIEWELREAKIVGENGKTVFEQKDVEIPKHWTQLATNVVVSKYFRGKQGSPERERSVKQMVSRVADTITGWGIEAGYFASPADAEVFRIELTHLLVSQKMAFNSPVWFNLGVTDHPQCSACFILSVQDDIHSILDWIKKEGIIFKGGSGSGANLSHIRSSREHLSGGGYASGPVSFMRGADASAGSIKSGGTTRRAAKMVILNVNHPDIEEFIRCKEVEEKKAWALGDAGYDMSLNGEAWKSIQFQNANNSVRVTDDFMVAVENDGEWQTKAVTDGKPMDTFRGRDLLKQIAEATWVCGDPGVQYDTVINAWHTCPNSGRINASNPCFTGDMLVYTEKGLVPFRELFERAQRGEKIKVVTDNRTNAEFPEGTVSATMPVRVMQTGVNEVFRLRFSNGSEVKATANHRFFTTNRGMVSAKDLQPTDDIALLAQPVECDAASADIAIDERAAFASGWGGRKTKEFLPVTLPSVWTSRLAEYVGFLVGDGSIRESVSTYRMSSASVVFGTEEEATELIPHFDSVFSDMGVSSRHTVRMPNGTVQLRVNRTPVVRFLKQLGVKETRATYKDVPNSIFQAPRHIVAAFLRGLFTADGCVYNGAKHRYVGLGSTSDTLLRNVQRLLYLFGIKSSIYGGAPKSSSFSYIRVDGSAVTYESQPGFDLRISGHSIARFRDQIGFLTNAKQSKLDHLLSTHGFYREQHTTQLISMEFVGMEETFNLTEPKNHSYIVNGFVVANCSEYMHLDDSACNLASLNLMKFLRNDGAFDLESYKRAIDLTITAQEIIVGFSSYPTSEITKNARAYRQLGLGYANLGALLMSWGVAYDSDEARAVAAALTAIMTGEGYAQSARIAAVTGPFDGYAKNADAMLNVIAKHKYHVSLIDRSRVPSDLLAAADQAWSDALELGRKHGFRNAQATVLAPTGTISFLMDCDTTGIEPDIALVKFKNLVGGGVMKIVNQTVPAALRKLGYTEQQIDAIVAFTNEQGTIEGAPHIKEEHLAVFDCAFKPLNGRRSIHAMGHVRMMAAVQPFISGAISKTVNVQRDITVDEIADIYFQGWKLGLKALAIYRDGSKRTQPLSTKNDDTAKKTLDGGVAGQYRSIRRRLPDERRSLTHKFSVAGHDGYVTVGLYDDNTPGEIFVTMAKGGSTIAGLMGSFALAISIGLQYGVPMKTLVTKFSHLRFEPAGFTGNPDIPIAKSVIDYIFRWLGMKFLPKEERSEVMKETASLAAAVQSEVEPVVPAVAAASVGPVESAEQATLFQNQEDAPPCANCGSIMVRNGSCYKCGNCGATSGCS